MRHKLLIFLLAMLATALPVSAYDFMVDGLCYNINANGTSVTVTYETTTAPRYRSLSGSVTIPKTVTYNGTTYSVTAIGKEAFMNCTGLTSVTIGNSVTAIGSYAFFWCTGLTTVIIPNSVTTIGGAAFTGCTGLTSVTIPNSVTVIGNSAFTNCPSINNIVVAQDNPKYDSRNNCNAIIETSSNTLLTGCKSTTIPNSVIKIGVEAFYGCSGLTNVTIPNSVTTIGGAAFFDCSGLTSVTIPNSVTAIGEETFRDCISLTSVSIGNSVTTIGNWAFDGCSGLTSVCSLIEKPSYVTLGRYVFNGTDKSTCVLYVPTGAVNLYRQAYQWEDFEHIMAMETGGVVTGDELPTVGEISGDLDNICMCLVSGSHKWQFANYTGNNGNFTFTVYNEGEFTPKKTFTINTGNGNARVPDEFEMYPVADHPVIMTQTFFNDDEKYEVIIGFYDASYNSYSSFKVYNEDGEYLLTLPFTGESGAKMLVLGQNRYFISRVPEKSNGQSSKVYHVHTSSLPETGNYVPADVNGDNVVSGADVTKLYDILLNQ